MVFFALLEVVAQKLTCYRKSLRRALKMGRFVIQNKCYDNITEKDMLIRVIVEDTGDTLKVISVYKTSKIGKYWIEEEA